MAPTLEKALQGALTRESNGALEKRTPRVAGGTEGKGRQANVTASCEAGLEGVGFATGVDMHESSSGRAGSILAPPLQSTSPATPLQHKGQRQELGEAAAHTRGGAESTAFRGWGLSENAG